MLFWFTPIKQVSRHSREGGNPSPDRLALSTGFLLTYCLVMDSRLRGNDDVY
jgi:hypothetical protein